MDAVSTGNSALQSLLRREQGKVLPIKAEDGDATAESSEYEAFSYGRVGIRPQLMLVLRRANGQVRVRPYAILQGIDTDDELSSLVVDFPGLQVRIKGKNLSKLMQYLCQHRVSEINELDVASQFLTHEDNCVVESMSFVTAQRAAHLLAIGD